MPSFIPALVFASLAASCVDVGATPTRRSLYENGLAAQKLNTKFTTMKISDPCTLGEFACINNGIARCVSIGWQVNICPNPLICAAVPQEDEANPAVIGCFDKGDALQRIEATGAQGGLTGNDSFTSASIASTSSTSPTPTASSSEPASSDTAATPVVAMVSTPTSDALLQSGLLAQQANAQFRTLKLTDSCEKTGDLGCIQENPFQCYNGYWSLAPACTQANTVCFAVPADSGNGTTVGCFTEDDTARRIAATGAQGGIYGSTSSASSLSIGVPMLLAVTSMLIASIL